MKYLHYYFFMFLIFVFSCNDESSSEEKSDNKTEKDTLIEENSDTLVEEIEENNKPKYLGSWIVDNLDNPFFKSERVDLMVANSNIKFEEPEEALADYTFDFLSQKQIQKLTIKELIYYCLAYPASYSQVCAGGTADTTTFPKIDGYLPFSYDGEQMSMRQASEIKLRRDSVVNVLMDYIQKYPEKLSLKYFEILLELDAAEAIPVVIKTASEKNLINYAFLLDIMHKNEYERLRELDFYSLLYGEDANRYENRAPATKENREAVTKLAYAYYVSIFG